MSIVGDMLAQRITGAGKQLPLLGRRYSAYDVTSQLVRKAACNYRVMTSSLLHSVAGTVAGIGDADLVRTARMGGYGLCIYGPLQHFWYRALAQKWSLATTQHFLSKV